MQSINNAESFSTDAIAQVQIDKPVLKLGSRGDAVVDLQELLTRWDVYEGELNGIFDYEIEQAVKAYQHRVFLKEDGIVGKLTWQALFTGAPVNMPVLKRGSRGEAVKIVQRIVRSIDEYGGAVDGIYGQFTEGAVRNFQKVRNLPNTGVVAERTWHALSKIPH